jgi:hypothetical protein
MHLVLLVLGVLCIVVGLAPVLWGLDYPFDERQALMLRGTIAIIGGLMLIAFASAISHLRRIREAIETLKLGSAVSATPAPATPDLAQAVVAEPPRKPAAETWSDPTDLPGDKKVSRPAADAPKADTRGSPLTEWPRVDAADRFALPDATDRPGGAKAAAPVETSQPARAEEPQEPGAEQSGVSPKPTVLKSGVIEGIPYTAYSDGSFEAEFTEGTRRFGSFQELRMHFASRGIA